MKIIFNKKVYGWALVFDMDIHLTTGTVIKHQFYNFRKNDGNYQWSSPATLCLNSADNIAGWHVTAVRKKFVWGVPVDFWKFDD